MEEPPSVLPLRAAKAELRRTYNQLSRFYDLLADRWEAPLRRAVQEALGPGPGGRALEVGPGTGRSLEVLAECVGSEGAVVGIDLSEGMLTQARARVRAKGHKRIELVQGDGTSLPLRDGVFDTVLLCFTLELFDAAEIPVVLGECKRVLKAGGRLAVVALSETEDVSLGLKLYKWSRRHFPRFVNCRPIRAQELIQAAGFGVDKRQLLGGWLPVEVVLALRA